MPRSGRNAKKTSLTPVAPLRSVSPEAPRPDAAANVDRPPQTPFGSYPERRGEHAVPPPAELARVPTLGAYCYSQLCLEIKYNLPYYLRKSDLMRYLREQHDYWWAKYGVLYEKNAYTYPTSRTSAGWDYTNAAKEMLSRCKLHDSLFTQVLKLDLTHVTDFGTYCKLTFLELNKLKPAFPDSPCSQAVFESSVRDVMKFVLKQAPSDFDTQELQFMELPASGSEESDSEGDD